MKNKKTKPQETSKQPIDKSKEQLRAISDEDLIHYLAALERSTDVWIQTFFSLAGEDVYNRSRKVIVSGFPSGTKNISAVDMLENTPFENYNIDLVPFLCILGDIQVFEDELNNRGLLESFYSQMLFERYSIEKGKNELVPYPLYAIRAADLILGYLSGILSTEDSAMSVNKMARYLTIKAKEASKKTRDSEESDEVDKMLRDADGKFMA